MGTALTVRQVADELGTELLPDNATHKNRMEIHSESSSRVYVVAQNNRNGVDHGRWECSCMGWIRHRNCKHLKSMEPSLKLLEANTGGKKKASPVRTTPTKNTKKRRKKLGKGEALNAWERLNQERDDF